MGKNAKGFTLIEVLIASVIIITVLSLAAMSFSNARLNSEKASDTLKLLAPVPIIMDTIREQIRKEVKSDTLSGDGAIDGVQYSWQASLETAGSPPDNFNVEEGTVIRYKPRYKIYFVQLSMSSGTKSETFEFKELAWLPRVAEVE